MKPTGALFTDLAGEIELDGLDADVGGAGRHNCSWMSGRGRRGGKIAGK
jgi:hypothetical protein